MIYPKVAKSKKDLDKPTLRTGNGKIPAMNAVQPIHLLLASTPPPWQVAACSCRYDNLHALAGGKPNSQGTELDKEESNSCPWEGKDQ